MAPPNQQSIEDEKWYNHPVMTALRITAESRDPAITYRLAKKSMYTHLNYVGALEAELVALRKIAELVAIKNERDSFLDLLRRADLDPAWVRANLSQVQSAQVLNEGPKKS